MITLRRKYRGIVLAVLIAGSILGFPKTTATASAHGIDRAKYNAGERNKYILLKQLVPVLDQVGKAGRIYYVADCPADYGSPYTPYPFPAISVQPPSRELSGVAAVRDMFRGNTNVEVEERPLGIIRIRFGKLFDDVLQTRIAHISLTPEPQYEPLFAIFAIQESAEVKTASARLDIRYDARPLDYLARQPSDGPPNLPDSLEKLTMDEALDVVAKTFGDIVMYSTCTKQHYITIENTGGPGFFALGVLP